MQPTCLYVDINLSTEINLQRSHSPATNQDFLGTTNKKCFSWDKVVDQFQDSFKRHTWFTFHYFVATELCHRSHVPTHEFRVFDQMFPFFVVATQITLTLSASLFQALCQCGRLKKRAGDERDLVEKEGTT